MTAARDFKLIGSDDFIALSDAVKWTLDQWQAHWFTDVPGTNTSVVIVTPSIDVPSHDWRSIRTASGMAYVQLTASDAVRLMTAWMIGSTSAKLAKVNPCWCLDFVLDLLMDWLDRMGAAAVPTVASEPSPVPLELSQQASGAILIQLDFAGEIVRLLLDASVVSVILKKSGAGSKPRAPAFRSEKLSKALQSQLVTVRAGSWLASELSIDAVRKLEIGDVVLLGRNIDQPWDFFTPNGDVIAKAYVGRQDEKRVVKVINAAKESTRHVS